MLKIIRDAGVNTKDDFGRTPLHCLFSFKKDDYTESETAILAKFLIQEGADISQVDNENRLPFHYAVANGYNESLELLFNFKWFNKRIDFDRFFLRNCPLKVAAFYNNAAAINKLLQWGFRNYDQAIDIATRRSNWDCVVKLIPYAHREKFQDLALITAANALPTGLRFFIDFPNLNLESLWFAAVSGPSDTSCLHILCDKKFNIQTCDSKGRNALFYSVASSNFEITKLLLESGVKIVCDSIGKSVFHLICSKGNVDMLELFHNLSDEYGFSALMYNLMFTRDKDGFSPIEVACVKGEQQILEYCVTRMNKSFELQLMHFSAFTSNLTFINYVHRKHGRSFLADTGHNNRTVLHYACMSKRENLEMIKFLCRDLEFDINAKDEQDLTPLLLAASVGNATTVEYLMTLPSTELTFDEDNNNVLHLACSSGSEKTALTVMRLADKLGIVDTLVASVNAFKQTPLHLAAQKGLCDVTQELICNGASINDADDFNYTPMMYCARDPKAASCIKMLFTIFESEIQNKSKMTDVTFD